MLRNKYRSALQVALLVYVWSILHVQGVDLVWQDSDPYYCIEDYKPVGSLIRNVTVSNSSSAQLLSAGHAARLCSAACDAERACTAFRSFKDTGAQLPSAAAAGANSSSCELLASSAAALPTALALPAGADWPQVLTNSSVTAAGSFQLHSVAWLCFKGAAQWDAFGAASHALLQTGRAEPGSARGSPRWCAIGTDVAGTNLQQFTSGIDHPWQCDGLCANTSGCTFWTFVASKNGSGQAPHNCFARTDPFMGQNGWTGPPKPDIWVPDSEMECFTDSQDWHHLGLILSPAVQTVPFQGKYLTVYPERVTWAEADAYCRQQAGGRLAVLDSRQAVDTAQQVLLSTLASQTAIRSAWVGARGNNTLHTPAAPNTSGSATQPAAASQQDNLQQQPAPLPAPRANVPPPETTLRWLGGQAVDASLLQRLVALPSVWSAHDVIWSIQYVPESDTSVCGRVLHQTLPPDASSARGSQAGIWFFDCDKPAGFICESPVHSQEPMSGRTAITSAEDRAHWSQTGITVPVWGIAIATLLPTLAVLLCAWQWSRFKQSRNARRLSGALWQQRKRLMGPPRHGLLSVVVTDIQEYTRLTNEAPDEMGQALLQHNSVIKQAADDNIGFVLEQEGDSFALAFHDPHDAAAFALQAQQALLEQQWHPSMSYHDALEAATSTAWPPFAGSTAAVAAAAAAGAPRGLAESHSSGSSAAGRQHAAWQHQGSPSSQLLLFRGLRVRIGIATGVVARGNGIKNSSVYKAAQEVSAIGNGGQVLLDEATAEALQGQQPPHGDSSKAGSSSWLPTATRGDASSHSPVTSEPPLLLDMGCYELLPSSGRAQHYTPAAAADASQMHSAAASPGIALWTSEVGRQLVQRYQSYLEHEQEQHADEALSTPNSQGSAFNGFSLASAVQQQQQLQHDEEQPYMLGSYLSQQSSRELPAGFMCHHSSHTTHSRQQQQEQQQQFDAGLNRNGSIAMRKDGQHEHHRNTLRAALRKVFGIYGVPAGVTHTTMSATPLPSAHPLHRHSTAAAAPLAQPRASMHSISSTAATAVLALPPTVRLYQLVSPALAGRAAAFGSKLSLPFNWRLLDPPVFDAPGLHSSAAASNSGQKAALPTPCAATSGSRVVKAESALPGVGQAAAAAAAAGGSHASKTVLQHGAVSPASVSIAVVVVEGADMLQQLPHLAGSVHLLLHCLMLQLLSRHFPGSYLTSAEPSQLRYAAAFSSAAAAAAWGMTLQEASLYLPYPPALLSLPGCGVQLDGGGRLVLRGPRLRLGLCEGRPSSISITSMGRAEYAGQVVHHAHRLADAIAQGGQLVISLQLAHKLLQQWQGSSCSPSSNGSRGIPRVQSGTGVADGSAARQANSDGGSMMSSALKSVRSLPANISALLAQSQLYMDHSATHRTAAAAAASSPAPTGPSRLPPAPAAAAAGADASPAGEHDLQESSSPAAAKPPPSDTASPAAPTASSSSTAGPSVPVECQFSALGSFLFRGSHGLVEAASLSPVALLGRALQPAAAPAGVPRAQCVVQRAGVIGRATVQLPALLDGWSAG
uniref:Apple domain-containing protein n=1 Tax=Tetradesmus obliquus TaxID=3088 RepID=A0A383VEC8_TETOB|eukprot:jgi/Sobl393_1/8639/SZX63290.1